MGGFEPICAFGRLNRTFHALEKSLLDWLHPAKVGATVVRLSDLQSELFWSSGLSGFFRSKFKVQRSQCSKFKAESSRLPPSHFETFEKRHFISNFVIPAEAGI
jgi:hypothetical protein